MDILIQRFCTVIYYIIYGVCFLAMLEALHVWFGWHIIIAIICSIVISLLFRPMMWILSVVGAFYVWHLALWQAILLPLTPLIIGLVLGIGGLVVSDLLYKRRKD